MSRVATFIAVGFTLQAAVVLWNSIGIFGIGNIMADESNTVTGFVTKYWGCQVIDGIANSCSNEILSLIGIVSLVTFGSGLVTLAAFGNTYLAYGIFLSMTPACVTLYDTITMVLDVFNVPQVVATGIGGLFAIVFSLSIGWAMIAIQGKTYIGP